MFKLEIACESTDDSRASHWDRSWRCPYSASEDRMNNWNALDDTSYSGPLYTDRWWAGCMNYISYLASSDNEAHNMACSGTRKSLSR